MLTVNGSLDSPRPCSFGRSRSPLAIRVRVRSLDRISQRVVEVRCRSKIAETDSDTAPAAPITPLRSVRKRRIQRRRFESPAAEEAAGFALLDAAGWDDEKNQPTMPKARFRTKVGVRNDRAREIWAKYATEHRVRRLEARPVAGDGLAQ